MADNVTLPGTGEVVATDDIGGVQFQRVKLASGVEGTAVDVSDVAPLPVTLTKGEVVEALEAMRMAVQSLNRSIGQSMPDVAGRLRVVVDAITASLTLATITTVGTVTTVSTVTTVGTVSNQTQVGGNSAFEQIPALMRLGADSLRRNVSVS
jgi:hypothetical protein